METNKIFPEARELTYEDFPTKWAWHGDKKKMAEVKKENMP
jgi:hypothetical protein